MTDRGRVERIELAPGLTVSRVLNGLWQIADMERTGESVGPERAADAMAPYVQSGLTSFDMADHYGSAEEVVGRFRQRHADTEIQALTKWVPPPGPMSPRTVRQAVDRACTRLACERLDLLQFHAWNYWDPAYLDALFELDRLRREGRIRHLGMTNCDAAHLRMLLESGIPIVSNQVCWSLLDRRPAGPMAEVCERYGVHLLAYGTLAGGFLGERWLDQPEPAEPGTWSLMKYRRFIDAAGGWDTFQRVLSEVAAIARRLGVSLSQLACRYVLEQGPVAGIIVGARLGQTDHLRDNLALFGFSLGPAVRAEIDRALAPLTPIPGDCGDEYRRPPFLTASGDLSHHVAGDPPLPFEPVAGDDGRQRVSSGTHWEDLAGYCRAVRKGPHIWVSGTTATHGSRPIGGSDPASQAHFILDKIEGALRSLGGTLEDVVRTRVFVREIDQWEPVARAHGERFAGVKPVNTLVEARLVGDDNLVEIEVEAHVGAA